MSTQRTVGGAPIPITTFATFHPECLRPRCGDTYAQVLKAAQDGLLSHDMARRIGISRQRVSQIINALVDERVIVLDPRCNQRWQTCVFYERVRSAWQAAEQRKNHKQRPVLINSIQARSGFSMELVARVCTELRLPYRSAPSPHGQVYLRIEQAYATFSRPPSLLDLARKAKVSYTTAAGWARHVHKPITYLRERANHIQPVRQTHMTEPQRVARARRDILSSIVCTMRDRGLSDNMIMSCTGLRTSEINTHIRNGQPIPREDIARLITAHVSDRHQSRQALVTSILSGLNDEQIQHKHPDVRLANLASLRKRLTETGLLRETPMASTGEAHV